MTDIRALYNPGIMAADLALEGSLLAQDDGLETAVILSWFTDRRANRDDVLPDDGGSRRGWWGDLAPPIVDGAPVLDDRIGSRLWLLAREKQVPEVLTRAQDYAEEALAWLIDDGIAEAVRVTTSIGRPGILTLAVSIERPAGGGVDFKFDQAWLAQSERIPA